MIPSAALPRRLLLALPLLPWLANAALAEPPTPVGLWHTVDDRTSKPRGTVRIEQQDGLLTGRIVSTIDPADAAHTCEDCPGDRKGQPIIGLQIIRNMRPNGDHWDGGTILDPETGKTYHCTMALHDNGHRLVVRGYIGISLFGRSQSWLRTPP